MVSYGRLGTPRSRIIRETIKSWIELLGMADNTFLKEIGIAWFQVKNRLLNLAAPFKGIVGVMSNVIFTLMSAGWNPLAYNCWRDEHGDLWVISSNQKSPDIVSSAICKAVFNQELKRASHHYAGLGLQEGLEYDTTMSLIRNWGRHNKTKHYETKINEPPAPPIDKLYNYKCTLETIMSAGMWPAERIHSIHPEYSPICNRCGKHRESLFHCFWSCESNGEIKDPAVSTTQYLIPQAEKGCELYPCLWLRGLPPCNLVNILAESTPSPTHRVTHVNNTYHTPEWGSGTYYGDASGGEFTSFPLLIRVGVGLCMINDIGDLKFGCSSNLPGEVQTVSRGEAFALLWLLELVIVGACIDYVTDNMGVFNVFMSGPKGYHTSNNCDIYDKIWKLIQGKQLSVTVRWMPSHLLENPTKGVYSCMTNLDILGNDRADKLAERAATRFCVTLDVSAPIIYYTCLVKRIQKRLVAITVNLPSRTKTQTVTEVGVETSDVSDVAMCSSTHVLFEAQGRTKCARCFASYNSKDPACKHWIKSQCTPLDSAVDRPIKLIHAHLHVGNNVAHHTHDLHVLKGLVYCGKCGARMGSYGMKNMSKPCMPPSEYGKQSLLALSKGQKPPNLDEWPSELTSRSGNEGHRHCPSKSTPNRGIALSLPRHRPTFPPPPPPTPYIPSVPSADAGSSEPKLPQFIEDLIDMVDLIASGEPVNLPNGHTVITANKLIGEEKHKHNILLTKHREWARRYIPAQDISPPPPTEVFFTKPKPLPFTVMPRKRKFVFGSDYRASTYTHIHDSDINVQATSSSSSSHTTVNINAHSQSAAAADALLSSGTAAETSGIVGPLDDPELSGCEEEGSDCHE